MSWTKKHRLLCFSIFLKGMLAYDNNPRVWVLFPFCWKWLVFVITLHWGQYHSLTYKMLVDLSPALSDSQGCWRGAWLGAASRVCSVSVRGPDPEPCCCATADWFPLMLLSSAFSTKLSTWEPQLPPKGQNCKQTAQNMTSAVGLLVSGLVLFLQTVAFLQFWFTSSTWPPLSSFPIPSTA